MSKIWEDLKQSKNLVLVFAVFCYFAVMAFFGIKNHMIFKSNMAIAGFGICFVSSVIFLVRSRKRPANGC